MSRNPDRIVTVTTECDFAPWRAPNFALLPSENSVPVIKLSEGALRALAERWLEDLYAKAGKTNPFTSAPDPTGLSGLREALEAFTTYHVPESYCDEAIVGVVTAGKVRKARQALSTNPATEEGK